MALNTIPPSTDRLIIDQLTPGDSEFIRELTNCEGWLKYIGDRHISSLHDAVEYIKKGPMTSYQAHGYGLWCMRLKVPTKTPIGICGLVYRKALGIPDLGFAVLPQYENRGYASEACNSVLTHVGGNLNIPELLAITLPHNTAANRLLLKLGFRIMGSYTHEGQILNRYHLFLNKKSKDYRP